MDEYDREELYLARAVWRRHNNRLLSAPDCSDPDHPGCSECEEEEDDE